MKNCVLILILLFLSSCSRLDVVLSFAPRYITNEVDDALDLSSSRYKKLKETIASNIDNNKKDFFSIVILKIDFMTMLTEKKEITKIDAHLVFDELKNLQKKIIYIFKPSFGEAILPLSSLELKQLNNYANEKFIKADKRMADKQQYYKHYTKLYERYMNLVFDSTNHTQDRRFRYFLDANYDYFKSQNLARKFFLKQFNILFNKKDEMLDFALKYYAGEAGIKSNDLINKQAAFNESLVLLGLDLWVTSTEQQRHNFKKNLLNVRTELKNLIR